MAPSRAINQPPDYSSDTWSDVTPIPLDEGPGPGPALAAIAYTPRYSTAMSYLRAVMAANEYSDRALALTADIISLNPAHYTVWLYRAKIIRELGGDVLKELGWLDGVALKSLKNYQICWGTFVSALTKLTIAPCRHHRQLLMSTLLTPPPTESAFLARILSLDSKNYHVWTYRQWLVSHFDLFDSPNEWQAVEEFLDSDVRNNSAWNHRWFLCFGREDRQQQQQQLKGQDSTATPTSRSEPKQQAQHNQPATKIVDEDLIDRECTYAQNAILLAPQNQSPWTYLRALYRRSGRPVADLGRFAERFLGPGGDVEDGVRSSHALDLLAEVYVEEARRRDQQQEQQGSMGEDGKWGKSYGEDRAEGTGQEGKGKGEEGDDTETAMGLDKAKKLLRALGTKWDPIRKGYWDYRIRALN